MVFRQLEMGQMLRLLGQTSAAAAGQWTASDLSDCFCTSSLRRFDADAAAPLRTHHSVRTTATTADSFELAR